MTDSQHTRHLLLHYRSYCLNAVWGSSRTLRYTPSITSHSFLVGIHWNHRRRRARIRISAYVLWKTDAVDVAQTHSLHTQSYLYFFLLFFLHSAESLQQMSIHPVQQALSLLWSPKLAGRGAREFWLCFYLTCIWTAALFILSLVSILHVPHWKKANHRISSKERWEISSSYFPTTTRSFVSLSSLIRLTVSHACHSQTLWIWRHTTTYQGQHLLQKKWESIFATRVPGYDSFWLVILVAKLLHKVNLLSKRNDGTYMCIPASCVRKSRMFVILTCGRACPNLDELTKSERMHRGIVSDCNKAHKCR